MCGIAGILNWSNRLSPQQTAAAAERMAARLAHRGPDDIGIWQDPDNLCTLIHRRLSIIDLSAAGHQPMSSPSGAVITFNGEIYNYRELRADLAATGAVFTSNSDTEVLLAGLDRRGADFLTYLDAMFAFGYWDPAARSLLLARDVFGEKPLYYTMRDGVFAFASELSALAELPGFEPVVDADAITDYLAFQYVAAPRTIYRDVRKLAPGSCLRVGPDGPGIPRCYAGVTLSGNEYATRSLDEAADELEEILLRSLSRRLISDVPLGAFLSGGVDSSLVVALAAKRLNRSIDTFTIGFSGSEESEHEEARAFAGHLGTVHHEEIVDLDGLGRLPDLARRLDEPLGDSSCLPTFLVSALARRHVTVAVTGDGGDELFGGYPRYNATIEAGIGREADIAARRWHVGRQYVSGNLLIFADRDLERLYGTMPLYIADRLMECRRRIDLDARPWVTRFRQMDLGEFLPGSVLTKVDRMSMQHGLEARTPFLSVEVASFAARLPAEQIVRGHDAKMVLRRLGGRYLPQAAMARPKRGFGLPIRAWADTRLIETARLTFADPAARLPEWLDRGRLRAYLETVQGPAVVYQCWSLLVLEHWLRAHPAHSA